MFSAAKPLPSQDAAVVLSKIHPMHLTGQQYRFIWSLNDQFFFLRNTDGVFPENGALKFLVAAAKSIGTPHEYGFTSKEAPGSHILPEVISILAFPSPFLRGAPIMAPSTAGSRPVSRRGREARVMPADATQPPLSDRYAPSFSAAPHDCCGGCYLL